MAEPVETIRSGFLGTVPHGFLGRRGGVSTGVAAGLNAGLGSLDDDAAVMRNRALAAAAVLPGAELVTPYQVHSPHAVIVRRGWTLADRPRADAVVTDQPGLLLGVVTADCAPVLLADREAGVIAAAHAGWRGAQDGVIAATVAAMEELGAVPARIRAAIGPCIAQASYEVDEAFRDRFGAEAGEFFVPGKPGHHHFDLEGYVASRLAASGVGTVDRLGLDTYSDPERFFSYRRSVHAGEETYGRQISLIGLPASA
ncbi:peptidoglycan editing factor PgeF [Allopontixanthobacter sp.]|uniref:peptidoglycan editing factor PgeF n=1 Tax=Allopontixanthobacter sp. TaxID=2906452 RepID=UPI002ABCBB5B|nr:peptidoglycan editing factor PgeF [Allopontixanthobacter sp.]MDZ4307102.1 peptidoglycan editing factor PgeF [Allopontixanthobacter sp.]